VVNVDGGTDYCSIWVGIDGYSNALGGNLVQAGIDCDIDASGQPN
jgi:hypothetical protein